MPYDFKGATDALFVKLMPEDLARELDCSPQSVRQARMAEGGTGHRAPPPDWGKAAKRLALRQAAYFQKVADRMP
jgi:hypothetical protein